VTENDDGLSVEPAPLVGGPWKAYADHRMAHAGAIIGLAVPGVLIDDIASTAKTLPEFPDLWFRTVGVNSAPGIDPLLVF
jgi:3-phosphoshikimate 1-carboxyvinyltransferase